MANEITIQLDSSYDGADLVAKVKEANGTIAAEIALTQQSDYLFTGNLSSVDAGSYIVAFFEDTTLIGNGSLYWNGTREVTLGDLDLVRKGLLNNMKVEDNQLTIYEDDGTTVLNTFDLFDLEGDPTSDDVFRIENA